MYNWKIVILSKKTLWKTINKNSIKNSANYHLFNEQSLISENIKQEPFSR